MTADEVISAVAEYPEGYAAVRSRFASARERILQEAAFRPTLERLHSDAHLYMPSDFKHLTYSLYRVFDETGSRSEFQTEYYHRRHALAFWQLRVFLGIEDSIRALEDTLWLIADEYSWSLPNHYGGIAHPDYPPRHYVDLLAAETAFAFAEADALVGDSLAAPLRQRLREEVEQRVFSSYLTRRFSWDEEDNNWAAVCSGSVLMAAMYYLETPEALAPFFRRGIPDIARYLASFGADGICTEGLLCWNYGFGYFCAFADLLLVRSGYKADWFSLPKVKAIASFQNRAMLANGLAVNFSDSSIASCNAGLTSYLYRRYGLPAPQLPIGAPGQYGLGRFAPALRRLVWTDWDCLQNPSPPPCGTWHYPDAGWSIFRRAGFALAAKIGHNGEIHNHNDIGNFIFAVGEEAIFCDLGKGRFDARYFLPEYTDNYIHLSSRGHSVPIIGGRLQGRGAAFRGRCMQADTDTLTYELAEAYPCEGLQSFQRQFCLTAEGFRLTDTFLFAETAVPVEERFITKHMPQVLPDGTVKGGPVSLSHNTTHSPEIEAFTDDSATAVYAIIYRFPAQKALSLCFRFCIETPPVPPEKLPLAK
ncbi:MAG: heparinase II/III-family protein [Oscillospiraceae bacterium]|jgi:hypothetical protein|nr:heparinase II/III-family protein [Oscillospiraceae bacterium]